MGRDSLLRTEVPVYHRRIAPTGVPSQALNRLTAPPRRPPLPAGPYLVVGLGRAGFAAARALAAAAGPGAVRVWDGAADSAQLERAAELRRGGISVVLGGDGLDVLGEVGTIVKSPGVPPGIPVVAEALRRGAGLLDEFEVGWRLVPAPIVGVTGTNGKSTTSALCVEALAAHGFEPVLAGNTEYGPPLSDLAEGEPPTSVVAEVSSYQVEFARALAVDAAVFTNLTLDHLNRHGDMQIYGDAKRKLFVRGDWCVPLASLNGDDALGGEIAGEVRERGGTALTYGFDEGADYRIAESRWGLREAEAIVETPEGTVRVATRLPGRHNAANVTAVLALSDGLGLPREPTLAALAAAEPVPGRFEAIEVDLPFDVVVDFAHSAASVEKALETGRETVTVRGGRLLTVISLLGRTAPLIGREVGEAARRLSDHLVICGASYRGEPRLVGIAALRKGALSVDGGELEVMIDRRKGVERALEEARPGDLVVLLGRGPTSREATDWRGGFRVLDDRQVVREFA
jgi:UDP-N-acetylmuramoyl-L-alanyl-D-glutamate--2,6-diaminopimelate ligase